MQRGHVTAKAGKNHGRWLDVRAKKPREKIEDPRKHKKHSRFKQHCYQVRFHVARGHGKVVPAVELHKWRKYCHQHDQNEHDFWHLALHNFLAAALMESASRLNWATAATIAPR